MFGGGKGVDGDVSLSVFEVTRCLLRVSSSLQVRRVPREGIITDLSSSLSAVTCQEWSGVVIFWAICLYRNVTTTLKKKLMPPLAAPHMTQHFMILGGILL